MPRQICSIVLIAGFFFGSSAWSQQLIERTYFSEEANADIELQIRLPKDHDPNKKYPVVYEFIYDHTDLIAAAINNFYDLPKTIVVFPKLKTGQGYYSTPDLDKEGQKYFRSLKKEIIPLIEKEYGASKYRIAVGLSMGADYINYILRTDPQLFNACLIFAIEKPFYESDFKTYFEKADNKIKYFIAIAEEDVERRIEFANALFESLSTSGRFEIKKKNYANVEHRYSLLYGLPDALSFAFGDYSNYRERRSDESVDQYYSNLLAEFNEEYGVNPHENQFIISLKNGLKEGEAPEAIDMLLDLMYANKNVTDVDFWNLSGKLTDLEYFDQSEKSLLLAKELNQSGGPRRKLAPRMVYTGLSKLFGKKRELEKGLEVLIEGHEQLKDKDNSLLFDIGVFSINNSYRIETGIKALLDVNENRARSNALTGSIYPEDRVYAFVSKGHYEMKNNDLALEYARKALELNPDNEFAKNMVEQLTKLQ